tara:strand:+ start:793 stop:1092 length:300 start_codon:yes stop_codon:yes gene_type:complete
MKKFKEKYNFYALTIIIVVMIIGGWNSCQAQEEKQQPQKIILEMELEQVIKITIPKVGELNKIKQTYPPKGGSVNLKRKPTIPEVDVIIKEEDYNENNK